MNSVKVAQSDFWVTIAFQLWATRIAPLSIWQIWNITGVLEKDV